MSMVQSDYKMYCIRKYSMNWFFIKSCLYLWAVSSCSGYVGENKKCGKSHHIVEGLEKMKKKTCGSVDHLAANDREMGNPSAKNEENKKCGKSHHIVEGLEKMKKKTCGSCGSCGFGVWVAIGVVLSIIVIVAGLGEIGITIYAANFTLIYTSALSGQLVAYIVLALSTAFAFALAVAALFALFKRNKKPLHIAELILFTIAVVQAITCGLSANLSKAEKEALAASLNDSFKLSAIPNPTDLEYWATISTDLKCCGVSGPNDYSESDLPNSFPPDVPIFCCPEFNASEPEVVQRAEREICKTLNTYYTVGCGYKVRSFAEGTAAITMIATVFFIVLEVILALHIYITYNLLKKRDQQKETKSVQMATLEPGTSCTR